MPKLSDLLARSKAAKGSQKELPPEEEMPVDAPPVEAPPEEALAGAGGEEMPPPLPGGDGGMPPMPEEGGPPDIDMALANVEASLEGLSPEVQEEVRTHLNAIRDLVGGSEAPPSEEPPPVDDVAEAMPPDAKSPEAML